MCDSVNMTEEPKSEYNCCKKIISPVPPFVNHPLHITKERSP